MNINKRESFLENKLYIKFELCICISSILYNETMSLLNIYIISIKK